MKRLRHTEQGFIRYMQMSGRGLFVFVEGTKADRYFYARICNIVSLKRGVQYETISGVEITGTGGGKGKLLKFFKTLAASATLVSDFKGKKTAVLFFLDKDIDDILRATVKSPHIVYTSTYDVEALIFQHGDLPGSSAALASLDRADVSTALGDTNAWRLSCAERWKEWTKICVFCVRHQAHSVANFHKFSQVNQAHHGTSTGPLNAQAVATYWAKIRAATSLSPVQFERKRKAVERLINYLFSQGRHSIVFKGKWYLPFLTSQLFDVADGKAFDKKAVDAGVIGALANSIDFSGAWAQPFVDGIQNVVSYLT